MEKESKNPINRIDWIYRLLDDRPKDGLGLVSFYVGAVDDGNFTQPTI